jgi:uncharacterized protein (TIGR00369 family)
MELLEKIAHVKTHGGPQTMIELTPYATFIGIEAELQDGEFVSRLPFSEGNIGNPALPAIHGGVTAGFLECAALFYLLWNVPVKRIPKVIDFSIDYLRSGEASNMYSHCEITRLGRRVALCTAKAWQHDHTKPIAIARMHVLLDTNTPINS